MIDPDITLAEAQRRLEERRKVVTITKADSPVMNLRAALEKAMKEPPTALDAVQAQVQREHEEWRKQYEIEMRQKHIAYLIRSAHLPFRHSQVVIDHAASKRPEWAQTFAKLTTAKETGFIMGLVGTRGNGKTQLAVELCKHYCQQSMSALFVTAMEFFIDIKSTFRKDSERSEKDAMDEYAKYRLLVVDEVGVRAETEWENQLLFELINRRYNSKMDTLLISNHGKAEFIKSIGPGLASRMNETGGIIECTWESFRK